MAVPLTARGAVLGFLGLLRRPGSTALDEDDLAIASELAFRAAVCIDNARTHQSVRTAARRPSSAACSPHHPSRLPGLQASATYVPAQAAYEIGGDGYDASRWAEQTRRPSWATSWAAASTPPRPWGACAPPRPPSLSLDLEPARVLEQLDSITSGLEQYIADLPLRGLRSAPRRCRIANAGHLPPVLVRSGERPRLLDLPAGIPLGVGGVPFEATAVDLGLGDKLVLYTDGLVETRHDSIDERLAVLVHALEVADCPLEETCDRLLEGLRDIRATATTSLC